MVRPLIVTGLRSTPCRFQTGRNQARAGQWKCPPRASSSVSRPHSGWAGQPASLVPVVFFKQLLGSLGHEQRSGKLDPALWGRGGAEPHRSRPQMSSLRGLQAAGRMKYDFLGNIPRSHWEVPASSGRAPQPASHTGKHQAWWLAGISSQSHQKEVNRLVWRTLCV